MKRARISAIALLLALALTLQVAGEYVSIQTRMVPVARLVKNLERDLKANPKSVEVRINLARLHGMAYALKTDKVPVARWRSRDEPY
jgi:hypothetical protein